MALEADGTCKAFVDGKCAIHDFSPALCQAFPFYFDMFSGLCAIECDGFSEDAPLTDLTAFEKSIAKAKEMYDYWMDFYVKN